MVSTLKLTKIQVPNSDSDVISLDASTGNITLNKTLGGTSVTIQGEGTATTNLQQGLAKAWLTLDGTGTIATADSFNIATTTDHDTGQYSYTYSNNIGTTKHPVTGSVVGSTSNNYFSFAASRGVAQATTGSGINTKHHSGATDDQNHVHFVTHGDLA